MFTPTQLTPLPKHKSGDDFSYSFQFVEDSSPLDLTNFDDVIIKLYRNDSTVFSQSSADGDNSISSSSGSNNDIISGNVTGDTMDVPVSLNRNVRYYLDVYTMLDGKKRTYVTTPFHITGSGESGTANEWKITITNSTDEATGERATNVMALAVQYKNEAEAAKDAAEAAAAGVNLPSITSGDADKFLQVKDDESGYELKANVTLTTATDVSGNTWVLDEDDFASDSNTKVPTQQSAKKYVDDKASLSGIDTIADLKAINVNTVKDGDTVYPSGYYTRGDAGGGKFYALQYQAKANGAASIGSGVSLTVDALPEDLKSGQVLEFTGGGIFELTADADKGATSITGDLTAANIADSEEAGLQDNGGTVIELTSGSGAFRWKRGEGEITAKKFGLVGDNSTLNGTQFDRYIKYCLLHSPYNPKAKFEPGKYVIEGSYTYDNVYLQIEGLGSHPSMTALIHSPTAVDQDFLTIGGTDATFSSYRTGNSFKNISLSTNGANTKTILHMVRPARSKNPLLFISGASKATNCMEITGSINTQFAFCRFSDATQDNVVFNDDEVHTSTTISSTYITTAGRHGIYVNRMNSLTLDQNTICESNGAHGVCMGDLSPVTLKLNSAYFEKNNSGAIKSGFGSYSGTEKSYIYSNNSLYIGNNDAEDYAWELDQTVLKTNNDYAVSFDALVKLSTVSDPDVVLNFITDPRGYRSTMPVFNDATSDWATFHGIASLRSSRTIISGMPGGSTTTFDSARTADDWEIIYFNSVTKGFTITEPVKTYTKGQKISFMFKQDATGGRDIFFDSAFNHDFSNVGNVAGATAYITFVYDGTDWIQTELKKWSNLTSSKSRGAGSTGSVIVEDIVTVPANSFVNLTELYDMHIGLLEVNRRLEHWVGKVSHIGAFTQFHANGIGTTAGASTYNIYQDGALKLENTTAGEVNFTVKFHGARG